MDLEIDLNLEEPESPNIIFFHFHFHYSKTYSTYSSKTCLSLTRYSVHANVNHLNHSQLILNQLLLLIPMEICEIWKFIS